MADDLWPEIDLGAALTLGQTAAPPNPTQVQATLQGDAPAPMGLSENGVNFIKGREGWSATPYGDFKQRSIGYGTKARAGDTTIDQDEGDKRLREETGPLSDWLNSNIKTPLNQGQHDALVSFGYNVGQGGLEKLKDDLNAGNYQQVADRMQSWNKAGGKVMDDLKDRRFQEGTMLLGGQVPNRTPATAGATAAGSGYAGRRGSVMADDDGSDLGSNLQQKPSLMGALSNPSTQAFLAGMASRLLTGGWGGLASNIGQGVGYGLEQAGNVQQVQHQQEQEQKKMDLQRELAQQHADTQLQVAKMHGEALRDVATTRSSGAHQNTPEYQTAYKAAFAANYDPLKTYSMADDEKQAYVTKAIRAAEMAGEAAIASKGAATGRGAGGIGAGTAPSTAAPDAGAFDAAKYKSDPGYKAYVDSKGGPPKDAGAPPKKGMVDKTLDMLRPKGGFFPNEPWLQELLGIKPPPLKVPEGFKGYKGVNPPEAE